MSLRSCLVCPARHASVWWQEKKVANILPPAARAVIEGRHRQHGLYISTNVITFRQHLRCAEDRDAIETAFVKLSKDDRARRYLKVWRKLAYEKQTQWPGRAQFACLRPISPSAHSAQGRSARGTLDYSSFDKSDVIIPRRTSQDCGMHFSARTRCRILFEEQSSGSIVIKNGEQHECKFRFEELNIVDSTDSAAPDTLGQITVFFSYGVVLREESPSRDTLDIHVRLGGRRRETA